jgi:hypothetical protein
LQECILGYAIVVGEIQELLSDLGIGGIGLIAFSLQSLSSGIGLITFSL